MLEKKQSITDYPKSGLDESIWIVDGEKPVLKENLKNQILNKLYEYLKEAGFKHSKEWIKRIKIIGSLTSWQWRNDSDMDVHVEVDVEQFIKSEFDDAITPEDAKKLLDITARQKLNVEKQEKLSGTNHPLEFYFELHHKGKLLEGCVKEYDGVYDVLKGKWSKPAREISTAFDPSEIYLDVYNKTEELARRCDVQLGNVKRDILDVKFLNEALSSFKDKTSIDTYKKIIQSHIVEIEEEIKDYMSKIRKVIDDRKKETSQYDDVSLRQKFLNKYSYIWLQKQLEKILGLPSEVTEDKLDDINKAIDQHWTKANKATFDLIQKNGYSIIKIFQGKMSSLVLCKDTDGNIRTLILNKD